VFVALALEPNPKPLDWLLVWPKPEALPPPNPPNDMAGNVSTG